MAEFFTADLHLFHNNILKYCSRPFRDTQEMARVLAEKYNSTVKRQDITYWLGDVVHPGNKGRGFPGFIKFLAGLHGKKILILGNHDRMPWLSYLKAGFEEVHTHMWLEREGIKLLLVHDPAWAIWGSYAEARRQIKLQAQAGKRYRALNEVLDFYTCKSMKLDHGVICGHMHNNLFQAGKILNVGVDVWGYTPVSLEEVLRRIKSPKREDPPAMRNAENVEMIP